MSGGAVTSGVLRRLLKKTRASLGEYLGLAEDLGLGEPDLSPDRTARLRRRGGDAGGSTLTEKFSEWDAALNEADKGEMT